MAIFISGVCLFFTIRNSSRATVVFGHYEALKTQTVEDRKNAKNQLASLSDKLTNLETNLRTLQKEEIPNTQAVADLQLKNLHDTAVERCDALEKELQSSHQNLLKNFDEVTAKVQELEEKLIDMLYHIWEVQTCPIGKISTSAAVKVTPGIFVQLYPYPLS